MSTLFRSLLLCCAILAAATNAKAQKEETPLDRLVRDAKSQQPEYAAWLLLELLDQKSIIEPARVLKVAGEAFDLAERSRQPYPYTLPTGLDPGISRESLWTESKSFRLDALTLRLRALRHIEARQPALARQLFLDHLFPLVMPAITCRQATMPDMAGWYSAAAKYLDLDHIRVVTNRIQSARDVEPILELLDKAKLRPAERALLLDSLNQALTRLPAEPRMFQISGNTTKKLMLDNGLSQGADWAAKHKEADCEGQAPDLEMLFTKEELEEWAGKIRDLYDAQRRGDPLEEAFGTIVEAIRAKNLSGLRAASLWSAFAVRFAGARIWPQIERQLLDSLTYALQTTPLDGLALTLDLTDALRSRDAEAANAILNLPSPQLRVLQQIKSQPAVKESQAGKESQAVKQ